MLRLRRKDKVPPGGYWCFWENVPVYGASVDDVTGKVAAMLRAQHKDIPPNLDALVEDAICSRLPPSANSCTPVGKRDKTAFTAKHVKRFLSTIIEWAGSGFAYVSQEEAERRAKICVECPMNVKVPGCFGCKGIQGMVAKLSGGRGTPYDNRLNTCGVCGCFNATQIWLDGEALRRASGDLSYPSNCWKADPHSGEAPQWATPHP